MRQKRLFHDLQKFSSHQQQLQLKVHVFWHENVCQFTVSLKQKPQLLMHTVKRVHQLEIHLLPHYRSDKKNTIQKPEANCLNETTQSFEGRINTLKIK